VRSDHPLRRIDETLDLDLWRWEVAKCYGTKGNVSEDPVAIMKMILLLFLDNALSDRELMRIIPERLDYMWFLGYGLDDTIPNHSVLSKARKRWGQEVSLQSLTKSWPSTSEQVWWRALRSMPTVA
jgi:transposase